MQYKQTHCFPLYIPKSPYYDKLLYELESIMKQSLNTNHTEPNTHKENPNPSVDIITILKKHDVYLGYGKCKWRKCCIYLYN